MIRFCFFFSVHGGTNPAITSEKSHSAMNGFFSDTIFL
ncbi:hypothetical protein BAMTA208_02625 [Bacillus amyloliquefaciens TA208]|nr:hypothetical protein BAMTA208_02625 [Bacillus amyloliquefaciens TA208]